MPEPDEPLKLIYSLEHAYTQAEFGFGSLKGADAGLTPVVVEAARRAGCDVHLALISIEEEGMAEQVGGYDRYARDEDDGEFEVVEMNSRAATASHWRRPDGEPSPLTERPVKEEEFAPPVSFDDLEPDEEHFEEATGNAGATYERTYSRTPLVLWPIMPGRKTASFPAQRWPQPEQRRSRRREPLPMAKPAPRSPQPEARRAIRAAKRRSAQCAQSWRRLCS